MPFTLPKLPYAFDALEPHIDARTMEIHYTKHHQGYADKLNAALEKYPELAEKPIEELLRDISAIPEDIRTAVRNNGGGFYNHGLFWDNLTPNFQEPSTELSEIMNTAFASFEDFKAKFTDVAATRFGSGWAWLIKNADGSLEIMSTANQDSPISENKQVLLGLDVWEHAYYLKYKNKRTDYVKAWWEVVNWDKVEERMG